MRTANILLVLFFFILSPIIGNAQAKSINQKTSPTNTKVNETTSDTTKRKGLIVDSADSQFFDGSTDPEKLYLRGNVRLTHDSIFMFCDTAILVGNDMHAKGNISIIKNDTIRIFSDSLLYRGDSLMAYFVGNVVLENGSQQLFTSFLQYDIKRDWAIYTDTALLVSSNMKLKSKRGIFHLKDDYINFYEKVTIEGEGFDLLSDSLRFYTNQQKAVFLSPTIINQEGKKIYCETGFYDIDDKIAEFVGNAQFIDGDNVSSADLIKSDENKNTIELIGNAVNYSKTDFSKADKIIYNKSTEDIELTGNAYYKNIDNQVKGDKILYYKKTDKVSIIGRSYMSNPPMIIIADDLDYDKTSGLAIAKGNVIWKDTASNYEIVCDHATYQEKSDKMIAYNDVGKPLLKNEVTKGDTLFLSGDTLISFSRYFNQDTFHYFTAFANVEMLNADIQAIGDSIVYSGRDSTFVLSGNPTMWYDTSQFKADTIIINMENKTVKNVNLRDKAILLQTKDFTYFDQIQGNDIDIHFVAGDINKMIVTGGAKSVFYMKDDDDGAFVAVNETECTNMKFLFDKGELFQTRYYIAPTSKMTPMSMANHETIKLKEFNWMIDLRPLTMEDLMK
ncbi:MAG: OstA-like protein [Saprospiraceae bacterium]